MSISYCLRGGHAYDLSTSLNYYTHICCIFIRSVRAQLELLMTSHSHRPLISYINDYHGEAEHPCVCVFMCLRSSLAWLTSPESTK